MNLPIDFNQVVIGGDSAGAQLASQFTAIQTNDRLRKAMKFDQSFKPSQIKGAILFGGFYNMQTVRETEFPRIQLFMKVILAKKIGKRVLKTFHKCRQ